MSQENPYDDFRCERVKDESAISHRNPSGIRCLPTGACRAGGSTCTYNLSKNKCECIEEKKDPIPDYMKYSPYVPPQIQELGDLYFWEWINRFSKDERLKALKNGIRPKGDFRPLTDTWIAEFFDQTTPQERVRFFEKGALPDYLRGRYVEEMRKVQTRAGDQLPSVKGDITIEEANEITRLADGGDRRRRGRAFRNNGYECAICLDSTSAEPVNTGCNHGFRPYPHPREWLHASCLRKWTRNHSTCPLCREPCVEPPNQRVPSLLAW